MLTWGFSAGLTRERGGGSRSAEPVMHLVVFENLLHRLVRVEAIAGIVDASGRRGLNRQALIH